MTLQVIRMRNVSKYTKPLRQMILDAMEDLGGERSISEVIGRINSHYPNENVSHSSVSTAMSDLSVNGPPSSLYPMDRRFLWRVKRGLYRLASSKDFPPTSSASLPKVSLPKSEELFKEHQVVEVVRMWFEGQGFTVVEKCVDDPNLHDDITQCRTSGMFGIDIVAQKGAKKWIVEAKGETKGGTAAGDVDFMSGIGQLLGRITKIDENVNYAIAIPNTPHFTGALRRVKGSQAILALRLHLILVNRNGSVVLKSPVEFYKK